jgi:hypothetical protein
MRNVSRYTFKEVNKWRRKRDGNVRCDLIHISWHPLDLSCTSGNSAAWRSKCQFKLQRARWYSVAGDSYVLLRPQWQAGGAMYITHITQGSSCFPGLTLNVHTCSFEVLSLMGGIRYGTQQIEDMRRSTSRFHISECIIHSGGLNGCLAEG